MSVQWVKWSRVALYFIILRTHHRDHSHCPLILSTFTWYYFHIFFSVFYHTRILPSFSIVLLFASESFFVFFFQFTYQFPFLSVPFCSFPSRYFLYFFCVIHHSITAMEQTWQSIHVIFRTICYVRLCCCFLRFVLLTKYL